MTTFIDPANPLHLAATTASLIAIFIFMLEWRKCETDADKGRLGFSAVWTAGSIASIFIVRDAWRALEIGKPVGNHQLIIIIAFVEVYILIFLTAISFSAYKKKGFCNLKVQNQRTWHMIGLVTLILELIFGLLFGVVLSIIAGIILGLAFLLFHESYGLVHGLIYASILGMSVGLTWGLTNGLADEFRE